MSYWKWADVNWLGLVKIKKLGGPKPRLSGSVDSRMSRGFNFGDPTTVYTWFETRAILLLNFTLYSLFRSIFI